MKNTDRLQVKASPNVACPVTYDEVLPENDSGFPTANSIPRYRDAIIHDDPPQTLLGYEVENTHNPNIYEPAYILHGSKGATYVLMRNEENNAMLLAINIRYYSVASVKGYSWFTDRDGRLKPVS